MSRTLALLVSVTLSACATPAVVHKTTNPPLTTEQVTENTPPDQVSKEPVEIEGLTLKFNTLGFRITLPSDAWHGSPLPQSDGSIVISFARVSGSILILIKPITSDEYDLKGLAEDTHQGIDASMPRGNVSSLVKEPSGHWSFSYEAAGDDGAMLKGYLAIIEVGSGQKRFLLTTAIMPAASYDADIAESKQLLDSIAPL